MEYEWEQYVLLLIATMLEGFFLEAIEGKQDAPPPSWHAELKTITTQKTQESLLPPVKCLK